MKLYNEARELLKGTEQWRMFEAFLSILSLISGCFAVSVVVFIRKDFGERYLSWLNLFFGYTVVANFLFLGTLLMSLSGMFFRRVSIGSPRLMFIFWFAFIVMSVYRRVEISRKINAGVAWHSMYAGTSLLPLPFAQEKIYKFFEPVAVFAVGNFLWSISPQVGLWLEISAVALYVNNHIIYYNERRALLDIRDAEIESKFMSAALSGKPARETAGFVVAESSIKLMNHDAGLKAAFENLSPELKEVLDHKPDAENTGGGVNQ
jgi:hypothetical protein